MGGGGQTRKTFWQGGGFNANSHKSYITFTTKPE